MFAAPLECPPLPTENSQRFTVLSVVSGYTFVALAGTPYAIAPDAQIYRVVFSEATGTAQMWAGDLKPQTESDIWQGLTNNGYTLLTTWRSTQIIPPKQQLDLGF